MRLHALAGALLLSWAAVGSAQEAPKPSPFKFEMHGFVSGSLYVQDSTLAPGQGQQSFWPGANNGAQPKEDRLVLGGDVRQSRFNFSVAGPAVFGGATPKGVLEIDWMGGQTKGAFGDVSVLPRLRLAYAELNWGAHRITVGQNLDLIFTMAPTSLSHLAFPFGYGSGNIGWRRPGVFGFHTFGKKSDLNVEFAWEVGRAQWNDAAAAVGDFTPGGTTAPLNFQLAEASGLPAVEARLTVAKGQMFSAFVTGHYNRVDLSGVGTTLPARDSRDVIAMNVGAKFVSGPLTLAATGFTGKNLAPLLGMFTQFNAPGDVHEMGGWAQVGFNLTKQLSIWGYAGFDKPNRADMLTVASVAQIQNVTTAGMLQYRDGGYAVGLEWIHWYTTFAGRNDAVDANQWIASANYFF